MKGGGGRSGCSGGGVGYPGFSNLFSIWLVILAYITQVLKRGLPT